MIVLSPKIPTSQTGIFYKEVVNDENKVVDKVFLIRYKDETGQDKQKTIGKYSQGIRMSHCKTLRDETIVKIKLGENLPKATATKSKYTLNDLASMWLDLKKTNKSYEGEVQRYNATLKKLIGNKIAENIKKQDIINLQAELIERSYALSTIQHFITMSTAELDSAVFS